MNNLEESRTRSKSYDLRQKGKRPAILSGRKRVPFKRTEKEKTRTGIHRPSSGYGHIWQPQYKNYVQT